MDPSQPHRPSLPRRLLLSGSAATAVAAALWSTGRTRPPIQYEATPPSVGPALRQPGIDTPQRPQLLLLAYDFTGPMGAPGAAALHTLLADWTDTLAATPLTATLGIGPALSGRIPLTAPTAFADLPPLPGDRLDPARSGADLLLQLTGDQAASLGATADRLDRRAGDLLTPRWRQAGHLPPTPPGETPRNLFGFKDGTANPAGTDEDRWIWLPDGPCAGGTFLVYRRIAMQTDAFGALSVDRQEAVIGRRRDDGSPLGGTGEHDDPDLYAKTPDGRYVIPAAAHIRLSNPRLDGGARMLRRGYTYTDGPDDQGLLFCAFMKDPALFVRVQQRLAAHDALTPFVEHRASAVLYVPPAAPAGAPLGHALFPAAATPSVARPSTNL
ncbi:Dyp-type peroxidase [Kitasatospora sp. LaBMicrA B282]|uniref:Dyp-type peroxidase n=1 Tax=Kitasatospora sp. LaBMicrA B282 TaxID=3420949 RepID=UPI003D13C996